MERVPNCCCHKSKFVLTKSTIAVLKSSQIVGKFTQFVFAESTISNRKRTFKNCKHCWKFMNTRAKWKIFCVPINGFFEFSQMETYHNKHLVGWKRSLLVKIWLVCDNWVYSRVNMRNLKAAQHGVTIHVLKSPHCLLKNPQFLIQELTFSYWNCPNFFWKSSPFLFKKSTIAFWKFQNLLLNKHKFLCKKTKQFFKIGWWTLVNFRKDSFFCFCFFKCFC